MLGLKVSSSGLAVVEPPGAHGATIRLEIRVSNQVPLHVVHLFERGVANFAHETLRPVHRVDVTLKRPFCEKGFIAVRTTVIFNAHVRRHVAIAPKFKVKRLIAKVAFVRPVRNVGELVTFEALDVFAGVAANVANKVARRFVDATM
mgnify:CR=1 FL=1